MNFAIDPLRMATIHQKNMHDLAAKMAADAGCIRQLLVGRTVRRKEDAVIFEVKEVRRGVSAHVMLYGRRIENRKRKGGGRFVRIGLVSDIELIEVQP